MDGDATVGFAFRKDKKGRRRDPAPLLASNQAVEAFIYLNNRIRSHSVMMQPNRFKRVVMASEQGREMKE
jgi:hypothetical protein